MKNKIIIIVSIAVILTAGIYATIDRIAIYALSRALNLDVTYDGIKRAGILQFDFSRLTCVDKTRRSGIFSERASIRPDFGSKAVNFDFYGVRFIKSSSGRSNSLDSLSKIVKEPFSGNWNYVRMSGSLRPIPGGLEITRFDAEGKEMRISLKGSILRSGNIKSEINISFSPESAKKIPEELSTVLLSDGIGGWKVLSVNLSGDYKSPSMQVTGRLFRLSVKEIVEVK